MKLFACELLLAFSNTLSHLILTKKFQKTLKYLILYCFLPKEEKLAKKNSFLPPSNLYCSHSQKTQVSVKNDT